MGGLFGGGSKPAPLPPPPPPIPPVQTSAPEVIQAERDQKRLAGKRKGLNKTVLGGADAAGGTAFSSSTGQRTLLGGQ